MPAYLDHAATTPVRPVAIDVLSQLLAEHTGNPTGMHEAARRGRRIIDDSRERLALAFGADAGDVIFTSGGTEGANLAVFGAGGDGRVLCSAVEHHAALNAVEARRGATVPVRSDGIIDLDALDDLLDDSVSMVSVMLVNNEVGVVQPLHKVARIVRRKSPGAVLHTDAVQAVSWLDVAEYTRHVDLVSVSAHKFGGPQGVGALIARRGVKVRPMLHGGGQERERRSGTHNVAGIAAMAAALDVTATERSATVARIETLRDRLVDELVRVVPGTHETVARGAKVAGHAHVCFEGVESEALLVLLDEAGVYASAGASCSSGAMEPSHVLQAMQVLPRLADGAVRFTLGWSSTDDDVDLALKVIPEAVSRLRLGPSGPLSGRLTS